MTKQDVVNGLFDDYNQRRGHLPKLSKQKFVKQYGLNAPDFDKAYDMYAANNFDSKYKPMMVLPADLDNPHMNRLFDSYVDEHQELLELTEEEFEQFRFNFVVTAKRMAEDELKRRMSNG